MGLSGMECDSSLISSKASIFSTYLSVIVGIPGLLLIGFYGSFANRFGLKLTLLVPVVGNIFYLLGIYFSLLFPNYSHLLLTFGSCISGLSGARNTFIMAAFTYVAESSSITERSQLFNILEACIYSSRIVGPLIVGEVTKWFGFEGSVGVGFFVAFLSFFWILLFVETNPPHSFYLIKTKILNESTTEEKQKQQLTYQNIATTPLLNSLNSLNITNYSNVLRKEEKYVNFDIDISDYSVSKIEEEEKTNLQEYNNEETSRQNLFLRTPTLDLNPLSTFYAVSKLFYCTGFDLMEGGHNMESLPLVTIAYFLFFQISVGELLIEIFYQKTIFHFTPMMIGYFGSLGGIMLVLSMVVLPKFVKVCLRLNISDIFWMEGGLWIRVIYYFIFSKIQVGRHLYYLTILLLFCGGITPHSRSYLSKLVGEKNQTQLFVALAALESIALLLAPLFTAGYSITVSYRPQLMLELITLICIVSAMIIRYTRLKYDL